MPTIVSASVDLNSEGLGRQTSLARSNRLTVGKNVKKSPSRLQRISKQLKLSDRLVLTPFKTPSRMTSGLDGVVNIESNDNIDDTTASSPYFLDEFVVSQTDEFFGEGRYGTVKKCKRISDKKLCAVKEVRSNISDDFDKACLENQILVRLNLANHPNIVRQVAFYKELNKQTTYLVMEPLNGMTLLETLEDESADPNDDVEEMRLLNESS